MRTNALSIARAWTLGRTSVVAAAGAGVLVGCFAGSSSPTSSGWTSGTAPSGGASSSGAAPTLVDVDTNQTLTAAPGKGVGVFIEYQAGGHWHVWWTCDTALTGLPCAFQVGVSVASGAIVNVATEALASGDQITQLDPTSVQATTITTTAIHGMTFDTAAGSVITLDAQVNGQREINGQSFLFFAQNGQANGGYAGRVADPLMLQPATP